MRPAVTIAGELMIRELSWHEREALRFLFERLGERSRYQRFQGVKRHLSDAEVGSLARVDHWHRGALLAWSAPPRAPLAVARYERCARFDTAEPAIAVADAWQGRGIGLALSAALCARARAAGIGHMRFTALADNHAALALARRIGPVRLLGGESGVVEMAVRLAGRSQKPPPHPALRRSRHNA